MQTIKSRCLMKRKSDNTTHLPWKTILMKLHLKKGDDWKKNWKFVLDKGVQGPIRQRPDFREAKHAYRRLHKEHVESTGQRNKSIHPAQQRKQNSQQQLMNTRSTPIRFNLELDRDINLQQVRLHPRSGGRTTNGSRI